MSLNRIDGRRCAVLLLDFTTGIINSHATRGVDAAARALALCEAARRSGAINIFVVPAHNDVDGKPVMRVGEPIAALRPQTGDHLLFKNRIGAFSTTGLDVLLRQNGRDTLIICGIATGGTVLSTTRQGYDLGYRMLVAEDACSDQEEEVHALLTTPVYKESWVGLWRVADIVTVDQAMAALDAAG